MEPADASRQAGEANAPAVDAAALVLVVIVVEVA